MAAGDITIYDKYVMSTLDGDANGTLSGTPVDLDGDTTRIILLKSTWTADTDEASTQEHIDDLTIATYEADVNVAYTTLGANTPLVTPDVTSPGAGILRFDAVDLVIAQDAGGFANAWFIAGAKWNTGATDSPLIFTGDMGADKSNVTGTLTLEWNANGIFQFSTA